MNRKIVRCAFNTAAVRIVFIPEARVETEPQTDEAPQAPVPSPAPPRYLLARSLPFAALWMLLFVAYCFGDTTWVGEWLTVWPPMLWTFALVPAALPLVDRRERRPMAAAFAAIAAFFLVHEEWVSVARLEDRSKRFTIGVTTWNIAGHDMNGHDFRTALRSHARGIAFLQETPDGAESLQPETIASWFPGCHWVDAGDCGVLSNRPLRELPTESVGPWTDPQLLACEIEPGREILLVNVRLMLPSLRLNPFGEEGRVLREDHELRVAQFPALADLIERTCAREGIETVILAGDFNTGAWARSLRPLKRLLHDAWDEGGNGWGRTMTAQFPVARIDQCWLSGDLRCINARAVRERFSDHRMVVHDIELEK